MYGKSDSEHLDYAASAGRAIVTSDERDFQRLHRDWMRGGREHMGIVILQQQRWRRGEQIRRLTRLLTTVPADEMSNRVEYLSR